MAWMGDDFCVKGFLKGNVVKIPVTHFGEER